MPPLKRRDFLTGAFSAAVLPLLPGCGDSNGVVPASAAPTPAADPLAPIVATPPASPPVTPPAPGPTTPPAPTVPVDPPAPAPAPVAAKFEHGVASGDPLTDRVILWTRATPAAAADAGTAVPLRWQIAEDTAFARIVGEGSATAAPATDYTAKIDVGGLAPGRAYYYRFLAGTTASPVGRTRTAPTGAVDRLRIAVVTCAKYSTGFYNAYRRVAERNDLQVVLHLGDYIYEGADQAVRNHDPVKEIVTLADYRTRYAQHRIDADLQELHRQHPMVWVWDDHEIVNDAWRGGAGGHDPAAEGDYATRRAMAMQAAFEWMPIRLPDAAGDPTRIHRAFGFGNLADLTMLDTRHYARDEQVAPNTPGGDTSGAFVQTGAFTDPAREMLGTAQQAWLSGRMATNTARWQLIGNQIIFSPLKLVGGPRSVPMGSVHLSNDKWDGYEPARDRALAGFAGVRNLVILTGDAHEAYAYDITPDPNNPAAYVPATGSGARGVEFVSTSVTTRGDETVGDSASAQINLAAADAQQLLLASNPHLKYYQNTRNGYLLLDVIAERLQAEFWFVPMVTMPTAEQSCDAVFTTLDDSRRLITGGTVSESMAGAPAPAP